MDFVSLHHHTTFSYLDGFGTPEQHVEAGAALGMGAMAFTEHGNVSSHVRGERACDAAGMKAIFGCELYTGGVDEETRSRYKWHLTVLAETQEGYRNLLRLVSKGWANGFYYEPTVSGEMLAEHAEGLIVLSGCSGSKMACDLLGGKGVEPHDADLRAARKTAERFKALLGDRFYLEAQAFPELERTRNINQAWSRLSQQTGIPLVVTGDVHYPKPEDNEMQLVLHAVGRGGQNNTVEKQAQGWGYDIKLTMLRDEAILTRLIATGVPKRQALEALKNSKEIAARCDVRLPKLDPLKYPAGPEGPEALLRAWLRKGWYYRGFDKLPAAERKIAGERVRYELGPIVEKGFVDYFLTLSDLVRFAKNHRNPSIPVGPARGSAAASLVCYLLRITEVNPLFFPNLLFERFIDMQREDLPDVDLDFDDEYRYLIREYLVKQWGAERVGNIGTFTRYKGKNSIDDVAKVYSVPEYETKALKELLLERASGDLRGDATIEDTIEMFPKAKETFDKYPDLLKAQRLEGNLRGFSVHAAGLVVANSPLTDAVAVYTREDKKKGKSEVVSIDKHDADYLNVLKIDVLGLATMGLIRLALEEIGMTLEELYNIPLDDAETLRGFQENDVVGIFQFDGRAMRSVNQELKPDNFEEVCDVNALARPGPLHSGAAADYIMVKHGKKPAVHYPAPAGPILDEITQHTNYQIVYQEQILQAVRRLANFTWDESSKIRKLISKKQGEQALNAMQSRFMEGTAANGIDDATATAVWKSIVTAGAYAFNAAHCVSYGMLAFWTMWLKRHHPQAFYAAALRKVPDNKQGEKKRGQLLRDAAKKGIGIFPPDVRYSSETWRSDHGGIRAGLVQVKGVGETAAEGLVWLRDNVYGGDASTFTEDNIDALRTTYKEKRGVARAPFTKGSLAALDASASQTDPFELDVLTNTIGAVREQIVAGDLGPLPEPTHTSLDVPYEAKYERVVWLGVIRERNLKDLFELHMSRTGEPLDPKTVKDAHLVNWTVMLGEDETDILTITVDRWKYPRFKEMIWGLRPGKDVVLIKGVKKRQYRRAIYVDAMWVIDPDEEEETDGDSGEARVQVDG